MHRPLEFRVYIPEQDKMVYFNLNEFDYSDRYLNSDKYPVQQYTGLVDKNGVKIFEGDVVSFYIDSGENEREKLKERVTFEKGIFYFGEYATNDCNFREETLEVLVIY